MRERRHRCTRSLRFVDIRDPKGEVNMIRTATALLACDPIQDTRIATYSGLRGDLTYRIWDWRIHGRTASSSSSSAGAAARTAHASCQCLRGVHH